jgi:arabinogalactan oligomer/maltooligosaccharide transport system permease protein
MKANPERTGTGGLVAKILLLGAFDALVVTGLFVMVGQGLWAAVAVTVILAGLVNWIYLGRGRRLPAKYVTPGVAFLLAFQVFVIGYSGYIAFTNYSDGHNSTKADAIRAIEQSGVKRVPDSPGYPMTVVERDGTLYFLVARPDGSAAVGTTGSPLEAVDATTSTATGAPAAAPGFTSLTLDQVLRAQQRITAMSVPLSDDAGEGSLRTSDASTAFVYRSDLVYDAATDTFTASDGTVYVDDGSGQFAPRDGSGAALSPGWQIVVGWDNFVKAATNPQLSGPLLAVLAWTFAFAVIAVGLQFALGLFLALVLDKPRFRGRALYRILLVLPFAFPAFLSSLVWAGLLNPRFGFVNQVLLGGAYVEWMTDPWLARLSVIVATVWMGYGYMFLVSTGALKSLPDDIEEAARVDGASPWRIFRSIKLPLLLVPLAPLLISSFAFNFNNFNVIYMLTRGGPQFPETTMDIGATDILISMVYKVAFGTSTRDYALASALSIVIFVIVAVVSIVAFRQTKSLEEVNG